MTELLLKVKPCPAEGEGVHKWVFHAACRAVEIGMTDEQAAEEIEFLMARAPNPASEVEDALRSARGERRQSPRWSPINPAAIAEIVKNGPTLVQLVSRSAEPIQFFEQSRTEMFIDLLFPGDPWLCVGRASNQFYTAKREAWRGHLQERSFIVPSPMSAQKGRTKLGKSPYHSEANTEARRFLVVEFDRGTLDQQAALLGI